MNIGGVVKIQSTAYTNAEEFFREVKPPYFEDYTIELVNATTGCYNDAIKKVARGAIMFILGIMLLIL